MTETTTAIIQNHNLKHIPRLRIDDSVFEGRFSHACSVSNCNATCCKTGVWVDLGERDKILEHAALVQRHMEPHQDSDPSRWFDEDQYPDADLPSGYVIGTQERDYGCVFLDSQGRCVLQKAAIEEGMDQYTLKPFFCVAFPIAIENSVLLVDESEFTTRPECCCPTWGGARTVFDVYPKELEFVLGPEGVKELRQAAAARS
jgi:Zn-finger nucleic acid-binding protein